MFGKKKLKEDDIFDVRNNKDDKGHMVEAFYDPDNKTLMLHVPKESLVPSYAYYLCEYLMTERSCKIEAVGFPTKRGLEIYLLNEIKGKSDWSEIDESK